MSHRFIGVKRQHRPYVKPVRNDMIPRRMTGEVPVYTEKDVLEAADVDETLENINTVAVKETAAKQEKKQEETEMDNVNIVKEAVAKTTAKRKVKIEKKEKGLLEPTYEGQTVLTESGKMLLAD